jgi:hypothetical protein
MSYFISLFKDGIKNYIKKLTKYNKPKKVIICMIYYLDEHLTGSWADNVLGYLGYNSNPLKLQEAIKQIYMKATCNIKIEGLNIIPFPMFNYLNGKDTNDYVDRVEPSIQGGEKIANGLMTYLKDIN